MYIADLHGDLLCYLAGDTCRTPYDCEVRCSIPQLRQGGVKWQVLPIFTETHKDSVIKGLRQAHIFNTLSMPDISFRLAIENASSFCTEEERLEDGLERLKQIHHQHGNLLYISLTWNTENRFGGGAFTAIGLKRDGEILLQALHEQQIFLDLSHASDDLAYEALNYIDKNRLAIPVMASHSNARQIADAPRNLPDELIHEIIRREGLIGLNFVRSFLGSTHACFIQHLEHFLALGAEHALCFGADFFYEGDVSLPYRKSGDQLFFEDFSHAGTYPRLLELWQSAGFPIEILKRIAHQNFLGVLLSL